MKTILHIGMPKTGSTALQDCLRASRGALAARGVLYPENPEGCTFNNHRLLVFGFLPFRRLPRHILKDPRYTAATLPAHYAAMLDTVRDQIAAARPGHLVLSSESLFRRLHLWARWRFGRTLGPLAENPVVAAYLRRPSEFYLSNLQQRLRGAYAIGPVRTPAMAKILRGYGATFGRDAVRPRIFHRAGLHGGDIVRDFLAAYLPEAGVDPDRLTRGHNANETLGAESMDLMRRYRRAFHPDSDNVPARGSTLLVRALKEVEGKVPVARPRLRPEIAEMIDYATPDPLAVRDAWGLVFPDLDYRRFERGRLAAIPARDWRLDELVVLDPATERAILRALARTRWARDDPARRPWIDGTLRDLPEPRP